MSNLISNVKSYGSNAALMDQLARSSRIKGGTTVAYDKAVPLIGSMLGAVADDPTVIANLQHPVRAFSWAERNNPAELFSMEQGLGTSTTDEIFGQRADTIRAEFAQSLQIRTSSAARLLEITALVMLASLPELAAGNLSERQLAGALNTEFGFMAPKAPLESAAPAVSPPVAETHTAPVANHAPNAETAGAEKGVLVGGAVAVVAVLGLGALVLFGGPDDPSDSLEAANEPEIADTDTAQPVDEAENDVPAEAATPDPGVAEEPTLLVEDAETDLGPDTWPGGRGAVPEEPAARRTLQIDPSGAVALTGSAPTWEVALQVLNVANENYPVDGVEIVNELTWHPDASSSIRAGDVTMAQAASFASGSNEITAESSVRLDLAADILVANPTVYVVVTGHSDGQGDEGVNVELSAERVGVAVEYLVAQGVIPGQIVTAAAGEDDPTASNDTAEGLQTNRRVELLFKNYLAEAIGSN